MPIFSLKNQKEFNFVNKHGSKRHGPCFIIVISCNISLLSPSQRDATFLGLKVSKKFSKKAVTRNKVRRRIKHLISILTKDPVIDLKNKALIVIPKIGFEKTDFALLKEHFKKTILQILQKNN